MLTEIKLLIKPEADKALKKQKEEFDAAATELRKGIAKLGNEKMIWNNMAGASVWQSKMYRLQMRRLLKRYLRKLEIFWKKSVLIYLVAVFIFPAIYKMYNPVMHFINGRKNVVVLWFVLLILSIEHYFTEILHYLEECWSKDWFN